jgi:hypothetical protein
MKRRTKKLAVNAETLYLLDQKVLRPVRGAGTVSCGPVSWCAECSGQIDCTFSCNTGC